MRAPLPRHLALVLGLPALTLVAAPTLAAAAHSGAPAPAEQTHVLHLVERNATDTGVDLGKKGLSIGDQDLFSGDLYQSGRKAGRVGGICTILATPNRSSLVQCSIALRLPKGQIFLHGMNVVDFTGATPPRRDPAAITGGTGFYQGIEGQATESATGVTVSFMLPQ